MRHYQHPLPAFFPEEVSQYHNEQFEHKQVQLEVEIQPAEGIGMVGPRLIIEKRY
jgi:hypothetical protein